MIYKVLYRPINEAITDGCTVIDAEGNAFTYNETVHYDRKVGQLKPAVLTVVKVEYNHIVPVGIPSHKAKWLKNGDEVLYKDMEPWYYNNKLRDFIAKVQDPDKVITGCVVLIRFKCPSCGDLH